ncbi:hypothetical protein CsSME_00020914 [Camellia sinensis var. sinensis]
MGMRGGLVFEESDSILWSWCVERDLVRKRGLLG